MCEGRNKDKLEVEGVVPGAKHNCSNQNTMNKMVGLRKGNAGGDNRRSWTVKLVEEERRDREQIESRSRKIWKISQDARKLPKTGTNGRRYPTKTRPS